MEQKRIRTALISVYEKSGLDEILAELNTLGVKIYSTGGTMDFIEKQGYPVSSVEGLTEYPSILDGRVKTLHPKVFGGILARREDSHLAQLEQYEIPEIDLVIVDLYPFEETVRSTDNEKDIIEKIDIGGISLIRAAAKNYRDVVVVPSKEQYSYLLNILKTNKGETDLLQRQQLAAESFRVSSHYDTEIFKYYNRKAGLSSFKQSIHAADTLRYGENPHQGAVYYGPIDDLFDKISGKELSFNNLVDVDAAVELMSELRDGSPAFAVLKHTNACGVAIRPTVLEAWKAALAGDPVSAFGGILITNAKIDLATAEAIDEIFYEVLIAPDFDKDALEKLTVKKKRIILRIKQYPDAPKRFKSLLNGVIEQDADTVKEERKHLQIVTAIHPDDGQVEDLLFANLCVKHLKSNAIALVKNNQLYGMGCGHTSRVDALRHAIMKARSFGFDLSGAVMASDAFFPFPDCVEIAHESGIEAVIQPGGSVKDQDSIDYCNSRGMAMVFTGHRHFKH